MSLRDRLVAEISETGPISVAHYMTVCLHDPREGYYATRPALGEDGDFITAPLVSQMFGELVGVWAASAWAALGRPADFRLVEIGPGDGTLMADVLRATRAEPAFQQAADLWLVETSAPLKAAQAAKLEFPLRWADHIDAVPAGAPLIVIANELLDCLPARQFVRTHTGWAEQLIGLDDGGELAFGLRPAGVSDLLPDAPVGAVYEQSAAQAALGATLAARIVADRGAALLVDYGSETPGFGDTLQALHRHEKVDPLADPGGCDLTVHADFPAVTAAARAEGAQAAILTQADFLARMGIGVRAEALVRAAPNRTEMIGRQLNRLMAADQMGALFKALCLYSPGWTPPPFDPDPFDAE